MIKQYIPKLHFKILNNDDINLDDSNIVIEDMSFKPDSWNDTITRGYESNGYDYIAIYLKDLDDYMTVSLDISYSYREKIYEGDYYTPGYTEIVDQDLWVTVTNVEMLNGDYNFDDGLYHELDIWVEDFIYPHLS
jgi:hypothetical protein